MSALRRRFSLGMVDAILAVALTLDLILEATLTAGIPRSDRFATVLVAIPFAGTVAVRRRWPAGALVACSALLLLQEPFHGQLLGDLPTQSANLVLLLNGYGAGAWLELRRSVTVLVIACALLGADALIEEYVTHVAGVGNWSNGLELVIVLCVGPWALGRFMRERHRRAEGFNRLAEQVAAERAEFERAAIAEERVLIGRELQDIIAHNVSLMVVQAGGARRLLYDQPDRARASLVAVEQTGREALAEMRQLLGVLRHDDDPRALAPQPGLDQLPELAESAIQRQLACELRIEGEPLALTPGVDLVAYRVIEAGLTDATVRGARHATVTVSYRRGELGIEIGSDGTQQDLSTGGLPAISERVGLYGGRVDAVRALGPEPFALRCRLPLEAAILA
jgi:signal transduction histidine kinase